MPDLTFGWKPIRIAPKDRRILGCDPVHGHYAIVHYVNGEWECVDQKGLGMGIGFYPTIWHVLPKPPLEEGVTPHA